MMGEPKPLCLTCKQNPVSMLGWHCLGCQEKRNAILRDPEVKKAFREVEEEADIERGAANRAFDAATEEERALWQPHHDRWMGFSRPFLEIMVKEGAAINTREFKKRDNIITEAEERRTGAAPSNRGAD